MTRYAQNGGLTRFDTGGSHSQNPNGGIDIGNNNSVEENETKQNNFIYSDRIVLDENIVSQYNLPKSLVGKSVADATKFIDNKFKGRNDKISQSTKNGMLSKIAEAQEAMKPQEPEMEPSQEGMIDPTQMAFGGYVNRQMSGGGWYDQNNPYFMNNPGVQQSGIGPMNQIQPVSQLTQANSLSQIKPFSTGNQLPIASAVPDTAGAISGGMKDISGKTGGGLSSALGAASTAIDLGKTAFGKPAQDTSGLAPSAKVNSGGMIAGSAMKGASAGMAFGPWGAAIGGVVGAGAGLLGAGKAKKAAIENTNNYAVNVNKQFSDNYFALGGELDSTNPTATRQDSIALKEDSLRMLAEYQKRGYKPTNVNFPNTDLNQSFLDIQKRQTIPGRKGNTEVIRNGVRKAEKFNPSDYRQNINENQFRQREAANGVLNMDIIPALYDKRVQPTSYLKLMGEGAGVQNDGVNVPYYGDMKIFPEKPIVKQSIINTVIPKTTVKQNTKVTQPVYTPKPVVKTNQYGEQPRQITRDNTRVGTSFTTIDPRILRKAATTRFALGGKMKKMGDGGFADNPFDEYSKRTLPQLNLQPINQVIPSFINKGTSINNAQAIIGTKVDGDFGKNSKLALDKYRQSKGMSNVGQPLSNVDYTAMGLTSDGYKINKNAFRQQLPENLNLKLDSPIEGFNKYTGIENNVEAGKNKKSLAGKGLSYLNENAGNIARYAPIAANALQLSQLKKPQGERLDRLDNRYRPEYVDEAQLQNIANQTMNNSINAVGQSGASQGQLRSSIIGSQLQRTKALSDAYGNAAAQNRATNDRAQTFNLGVDQVNLQQSNTEKENFARDQAAYRNAKREYITGIGEGIGDIGKEQVQKKIIAKTTGYRWDGTYVKDTTGNIVTDPTTGKPMTEEKLKEIQSIKDKKALGGYLIKNKVK